MTDKKALHQNLPIAAGLLMVALALCLSPAVALAQKVQDTITVASCPDQPKLPVTFQIDCSHITDPEVKKQCGPFIRNQACRVFPAYRAITGIRLETRCKSLKFTIYEDQNWPHPKGEGGLALQCAVDYLAKYSVQFRADSPIGPYDVHELLHEYHLAIGPLPNPHILFGSSMAQAMQRVGDLKEYDLRIRNMQEESRRLAEELKAGKIKSADRCFIAQTQLEESLYLENHKNVSMFYLKLMPQMEMTPSQAQREARFSRMLFVVAGGKPEVRQFLIENGCSKF
ncbi:MAG: hypothetical protein LAP21_15465 [Acidobacteriia bacterium]|nr:hypothetical protein [Terriglobia bacterium]